VSNKLVIRPRIKKNESVIGYAMRLAEENAQMSFSRFLKNNDCYSQFLSFSSIFLKPLVEMLSIRTGHSIALDSNFEDIESKSDWLNSPSLCPKCIKTDGIHRTNWQYKYNSYCFEHRNDLMTRCKTCNKELTWNISLLKGYCHRCKSDLSDDCIAIDPPILALKQLTLSGDELTNYIDKLRTRVERQRRPFDLLMDYGFSGEVRYEWGKLVREASEQMEQGINLPTPYTMLFTHGCYPVMDEYYLPSFYRFSKKHQRESEDIYDTRYYVDLPFLSFYLGLSEYDLKIIINTGLIKDVERKGWTHSYFDYRDWHRLLEQVRTGTDNLVSLADAMKDAGMLWSKPIYLLTGILKGKVAVQLSNIQSPSFKDMKVDRASAHYWYRKNAVLKKETLVMVSDAAKIMGRSNSYVYQLIEAKKLESWTSNHGHKSVSVESLDKYLIDNQTNERDSVVTAFPPPLKFDGKLTV
jgi:hypothetical protein